MALDIWQVQSLHSLGTFQENTPSLAINLPVANDQGVVYSLISGNLPSGLSLSDRRIVGTPAEVARPTQYQFCIRGTRNGDIADRTLTMTIEGSDSPEFITPGGDLALKGSQYYVLDNTYVDFQLEAYDSDTAAGQQLTYFIESNNGQLPPGLTLDPTGRIYGVIEPALSIKPSDGTGTFDNTVFDAVAYDFATTSTGSLPPTHLNRYYEFIVSVSDGDTVTQRQFRIYVVTGDFLKADSTICTSDNTNITADATYLNPPTWKTPSDLGTLRASNYITLPLETNEAVGITYRYEQVNTEILATTLKPSKDSNSFSQSLLYVTSATTPINGYYLSFTKEFYPKPWAVLTYYKKGDLASYNNTIYYCTSTHTTPNNGTTFVNELDQNLWASFPINKIYQITNVSLVSENYYCLTLDSPLAVSLFDGIQFYIGSMSQLPAGTVYNSNTSIVFGTVPYQPAYTKQYKFTVSALTTDVYNFVSSSPRVFTVDLVGEIDQSIVWITDSDLGKLSVQETSLVQLTARLLNTTDTVVYTVTSGSLPAGLTLNRDGSISGTVTDVPGVYSFVVTAANSAGFVSTEKIFTITVVETYTVMYSNLYMQPYLPISQRNIWTEFLTNNQVFDPLVRYRSFDPEFATNLELKTLVYAGLETKPASDYISAMQSNFKKKRLQFGSVNTAVAYIPGTFTPVYEVVYIDLIDPLERNQQVLPEQINSAGHDNLETYYPSSIHTWRQRLSTVGSTEHEFLPLWMRSVQLNSHSELGYVLAVPLYYCLPGTSSTLVKKIEQYCRTTGFAFNQIDFSVDRITINRTVETGQDKYLEFPSNSKNV